MGPVNCLVIDILQNIFLCVRQKKEIQLKQLESEYVMTEFSFSSELSL